MPVFVLWLVMCLLSGCGCGNEKSAGNPSLRIGVLSTGDVLPLFVAEERKLFAQHGVEVELVPFQSAMERDTAFQSGQIDGMTADLVSSCMMRACGLEVQVVVATIGAGTPGSRVAILASPKSEIQTVADLKNTPIATSTNSVVEFILDEVLRTEGFVHSDIRKMPVAKISARVAMLIEDQVPAAILPDPLAAYAEAHGARAIIDDSRDRIGIAVLTFRTKSLESKGQAVRRLLAAWKAAATLINSDRAGMHAILARTTKLPAEVADRIQVVEYPIERVPTPKDVERVTKWLSNKGLLEHPFAYEELVNDQFLY